METINKQMGGENLRYDEAVAGIRDGNYFDDPAEFTKALDIVLEKPEGLHEKTGNYMIPFYMLAGVRKCVR